MYESDEVYKFLIDRIKHPKADRSFLNERYAEVTAWRAETVPWVRSLMFYEPELVPFDTMTAEEQDFGTYIRKHIYFNTAKNCKVPAYLLVPKGLTKPAPAIVALHDHSGKFYWGKEKLVDHKQPIPNADWVQMWRYGNRGFASAMAERGYIVLVIDSLGWGERGWLRESWLRASVEELNDLEPGSEAYIRKYDEIWARNVHKMENVAFFAGVTIAGIQIWDDIRSLDYLCSLPEVDAGRIGCVGLSMGGFRSVMLAALDERIKCSCPVAYMLRYQDAVPHRCPGAGFMLPGLYDSLPYPDFAALMMPRKMHVIYCENDHLFDLASTTAAVTTIAASYQKAGIPENFFSTGFPVGHQFDRQMQEYVFDWFDSNM